MKKKSLTPFNVINYDVNRKEFVAYDVMPYLVSCYDEAKKKKRNVPKTFDEFKKFVEGNSMYMYWSRCQWEHICVSWPCEDVKTKIDVHYQLMMNLDLVTKVLMDNVGIKL